MLPRRFSIVTLRIIHKEPVTKAIPLRCQPGMKTMFKTSAKLAKGVALALGASALAVTSLSPAMAQDERRSRGGPSAGEVIAGIAVIGGIAALAGAFDGDRGRNDWRGSDWHDSNWRGPGGWQGHGFGRSDRGLVQQCARTAEISARRFGGWRFAHVTEIRDVDRTRRGFVVRGVLEVQGRAGFGGRDFDRGRFSCLVDGRGPPLVEFSGIRGLR